jgi:hypothetical protein
MAYIGTKPANQVIDSTLIADGTVTTSDIADNAITTAKIAAGAVVEADISNGAVTASKLASTLDLTGKTVTLPAGTGGKVLQVVQGTTTTATSTSSTSFVDTNLSAAITPSSSSSKILVIVSGSYYNYNTSYNCYGSAALVRNSTALIYTTHMTDVQVGSGTGPTMSSTMSMNYLDSPATTSSTTYKIQIRCQDSSYSANVRFPFQSGYQTASAVITLMEIAG